MYSKYHIANKFLEDRKNIKIGLLYLIMVGGGVLHLSGFVDQIMVNMASFVMLTITIWLVYEFVNYWRKDNRFKQQSNAIYIKFYDWIFCIFTISLVIENIGVKTGAIFGNYKYGPILQPFFISVPISIGFAWINTLLPSMVIADQLLGKWRKPNPFLITIVTALLMVIFDYIMEPSAVKLGYWSWEGGEIPIQNYAAWFVLGSIFTFIGIKLRLLRYGTPVLLVHAFITQLLYFGLIALK